MIPLFVKNLKPGDEVTWMDGEMGTCNATGIISSITIHEVNPDDPIVLLTLTDGRYIEAYPSELF